MNTRLAFGSLAQSPVDLLVVVLDAEKTLHEISDPALAAHVARALTGFRDKTLKRVAAESPRTKPITTRFKGLGEMSPLQLRETTMAPQTRRLVQMTIDAKDSPDKLLDMLLAKKRAGDRREWLESKGNLAHI